MVSSIRYKTIIFCLTIMLWIPNIFAQSIHMEGTIKDSLNEPVLGANMIAKPLESGQKIAFAISDYNGKYKLTLNKDIPYALSITSIGYATINDTIQLSKNLQKDIRMKASREQLEEVVVRAKMAMIVEKDTITYRPDTFVTGNERKLREMLEKLPGVEVDREGNVTVNGKQVTDLLVDGKSFFGGDTKLGVNHIPADVVEEVEVIDDYHEVSFMKGLQQSERMAMNIKLKEGKKEFMFGEVQAGAGIEDRYYIQPSIFYYSAATTVNFIGSFNNINQSPLSGSDVRRFSGGYSNYSDSPINTSNSYLYQFSSNPDILQKKTVFGAANFTHKISKSLNLEAYAIANQQKSNALTENETQYLTQDNLFEKRETEVENKGFTNVNSVKLRYEPNLSTDVAYSIVANYNDLDNYRNIHSQVAQNENVITTKNKPEAFELEQNLRWSSQPKYESTSEINASHSYNKNTSLTDWVFDKPLFSDVIPSIDEGEMFNFLQNYQSSTHTANAEYKHFFVINNTNHLYPFAGIHFYNQTYSTMDSQILEDGSEHSFQNAGFNNDIDYQLLNPYVGIQYKFMLGNSIFRPGVTYQQYFWRANQFDEEIVNKNKGVFLPEFHAEIELSRVNKIVVDYAMRSTFQDAKEYANRFRLESFNQLYQGNSDVENELYHNLTAHYRSSNIMSQNFYNFGFTYNRREKSVRQTTILEGIDQISTSIYSDLPENNYSFMGNYSLRLSDFTLGSSLNTSLSDYSRIINQEQIDYTNKSLSYRLQVTYKRKDAPYIRVGWTQRFVNSSSDTYKNNYMSIAPNIELEYRFLKDFVFKADYQYTYNNQKTIGQSDSYEYANASLYYNKKNSLWGFELRAENLFDLKYKHTHSMSQFMVYDQWIYIQPRTVLFIISYKL